MNFTCCFPGCEEESRGHNQTWLILEAPGFFYDQFPFCAKHGKAIQQKQHDSLPPTPVGLALTP